MVHGCSPNCTLVRLEADSRRHAWYVQPLQTVPLFEVRLTYKRAISRHTFRSPCRQIRKEMVVTLERVLLLLPILMGCGGLQVIYPPPREKFTNLSQAGSLIAYHCDLSGSAPSSTLSAVAIWSLNHSFVSFCPTLPHDSGCK